MQSDRVVEKGHKVLEWWGGALPDEPIERRRDIIIIVTAFALVLPGFLIPPVLFLQFGPIPSAWLTLGGFSFGALSLWLTRWRRTRELAATLLIVNAAGTTLAEAFLVGGVGSPALLWTVTVPLFAQLLLRPAHARALSIGTTVMLVAMFLVAPGGLQELPPSQAGLISFACVMTAILMVQMMVHYNAKTEEELLRRLRAQQQTMLGRRRVEALGRVAGGVAHDFNNLLTVISSYSAFLRVASDPDEIDQALVSIEESVLAATALTSQLLAYGRRQVLEPRVCDLVELVRGHERMTRRVLGDGIELVTTFPSEPTSVLIDPKEVPRILMSLAANSRDAMPDGGEFHVIVKRCAREGVPGVLLTVSDNGVGMSAEDLDCAFDPFFTTKHAGVGSGLGLAAVQGLVAQSGGTVELESVLGKGTRVDIWVPSVASAESEEAPQTEPPRPRLLLVEDDFGVRRIAERILSRNFDVTSYESADQALLDLRSSRAGYDAIVSDIVMPGMSGADLVRYAIAMGIDSAFVLMSGYSPAEVAGTGVPEGAFFLQKPFHPDELNNVVQAAISCRQATPMSGNPAVSKVEVEAPSGTLIEAKEPLIACA